jgi:hypothetical protein
MAKKTISTSSHLLKILEEQVFILNDLMVQGLLLNSPFVIWQVRK